jgi:threonine/homoserine/homoserine lactone efflux protein
VLVALGSFLVAATLIVLLPGPDSLVVLRGLVRGGRAGGLRTAAGVLCGLAVWAAAAALGLSSLLRTSEVGYDILRVLGAAYLLWLGVQSLRSVRQAPAADNAATESGPRPAVGRSGFAAGLLTDVLNPKVGVFFVSFLPGFVPHGYAVGPTTLVLGGIYLVLTAAYFTALIAVSGTVTRWMATARVRRRLETVTGVVLIGFGVRLASEF